MKEVCDIVAERVALGEPPGDAAEHAATCPRCRRLSALPTELGATHHDIDPGIGFAARITAGAQKRITVRHRRRVAATLAAAVVATTLGVVFLTRQPSDHTVAVQPAKHDTPATATTDTHDKRDKPDPESDQKVDEDVRYLVGLARTDRAAHSSANWRDIEKPLAAYKYLGRSLVSFWPAASDAGAAGAAKAAGSAARTPPAPPAPPTPPTPPGASHGTKPPAGPVAPGVPGGVNVSIHDGRVQIDGIDKMVDEQIDSALRSLDNPGVPAGVRAKATAHLEKVRAKIKAKLGHIDASNLDQLGEQLGELGDEIGGEMDQFGSDLDTWGDKFGKDIAKKVAKDLARHGLRADADDDDDDSDLLSPPDSTDDDDVDQAVRDLGDLSLSADQRARISAERARSDAEYAKAKRALDAASDALEKLIANGGSEADVSKAIDAVTQEENAIRKARLLAWVRVRSYLDASQRTRVESAAAKKRH